MKTKNENLESALLQKFEVEELEKRYEFGWRPDVKVSATYEGYGASATFSTQ